MKTHLHSISFIRSVVAGAFTGLVTAIVTIVFIVIYRSITGVDAYMFSISPVFVYIAVPLFITLAGLLLYVLTRYFDHGTGWYSTFFILLTILAIVISPRGTEHGAKGLLVGLELIIGLAAAGLLPYMAVHPDIFMNPFGRDAS